MPRPTPKPTKRKRYAKPISLYPLSFTEAVSDLLKTTPPPEDSRERKSEPKTKSEKKQE